ncbi:hypothetical protein [Paenibacillus sp. RC84]|uniref:hypothetical protein n=1 Tax=Paenibacillus sp. RC84 TaxID=3156252 RepID=UPI0035146A9C
MNAGKYKVFLAVTDSTVNRIISNGKFLGKLGGGFCLRKAKSPLRRFGEKGQLKKMLLDGRVKFQFDAFDLAPAFDVDRHDHRLEECFLRFERLFGSSF